MSGLEISMDDSAGVYGGICLADEISVMAVRQLMAS